jgi:hypothetical protein
MGNEYTCNLLERICKMRDLEIIEKDLELQLADLKVQKSKIERIIDYIESTKPKLNTHQHKPSIDIDVDETAETLSVYCDNLKVYHVSDTNLDGHELELLLKVLLPEATVKYSYTKDN